MPMKKCIFMDEEGICHGKYMGFRCIGERCEIYNNKIYQMDEDECAYYINGYCKKFAVFGCRYPKDKTKCPYFKRYLEEKEKKILGRP